MMNSDDILLGIVSALMILTFVGMFAPEVAILIGVIIVVVLIIPLIIGFVSEGLKKIYRLFVKKSTD